MVRRAVRVAVWLLFIICISLAGLIVVWPGTTVIGIDIGGLTYSAAKSMIAENIRWDSRQILLRGNGKEMNVLLAAELGVRPDLDATVRACMRPIWKAFTGREKPLRLNVDQERFRAFTEELARFFEVPVKDAKYEIAPGDRVIVVPHQTGKRLSTAAFQNLFTPSGYQESIPDFIELQFMDISPGTRTEELEAHMPLELISSYTTYYAASQTDRAYNIGLASSTLSEVTIRAGETFSFNETVGPRTPERGYRKAPVIVGEALQDDYGGGVCQVSTTVYVAMLKAGFSVTERYCHGLPVSYVPLGLDATVAWDYLDLKMTNPGPAPCLVRATANRGSLTVDVFGRKIEGLSIEVESRVMKEYPAVQSSPPSAEPPPAGDGGGEAPAPTKLRPGYLVETVRRWVRNGVIELTEKLNTSMYPAENPKR